MNFRLLILALCVCVVGAFASFDKGALCSGVKICLATDLPTCSAKEKKPNPDINYNADFCRPFWELKNRGFSTKHTQAYEVYNYLGREYRIIYQLKGQLPVNEDMMLYLFEHMPFTAHLVNAYRGTNYTIKYKTTDRRNFEGNNGGNLSGRFNWILQDSSGHHKGLRNVFWGFGRTKIMMWKMHGVAVVFLDLYPVDKKNTRYDLKAVVFPANSVLNGIMKMDMFRNVVQDKILEIVTNIDKASNAYAKGDHAPIAKYKHFSDPALVQQLKEFDAIVKGSGYDLGQAGKTHIQVTKPKVYNPHIKKNKY